jgi:hypothetical protein
MHRILLWRVTEDNRVNNPRRGFAASPRNSVELPAAGRYVLEIQPK